MLISGMVGVSPGTTTLRLNGAPHRQDPGIIVRNNDGNLMGGQLGIIPNDFQLAKIYGYLPVHEGWITARRCPHIDVEGIAPPPLGGCSVGCGRLGDEAAQDLQIKKLEEELKTLRSTRIWTAVTAMAALGGLAVSFYTMRKGRR